MEKLKNNLALVLATLGLNSTFCATNTGVYGGPMPLFRDLATSRILEVHVPTIVSADSSARSFFVYEIPRDKIPGGTFPIMIFDSMSKISPKKAFEKIKSSCNPFANPSEGVPCTIRFDGELMYFTTKDSKVGFFPLKAFPVPGSHTRFAPLREFDTPYLTAPFRQIRFNSHDGSFEAPVPVIDSLTGLPLFDPVKFVVGEQISEDTVNARIISLGDRVF